MKPLDDMLPAEQQHAELVTSLQQAYHAHPSLSPTGQEQIIARVRERLATDPQIVLVEDLPGQRVKQRRFSSRKLIPFVAPGQSGRPVRFISTLAAVLVVAVLVGISSLLFAYQPLPFPIATSPGIPPTSMVTGGSASKGGLEMTMRMTPGPYFLSELVAVDLLLTNHTHTTFMLEGPERAGICGSALFLTLMGGQSPQYMLPSIFTHAFVSCPLFMTTLAPAHTLTIHQFVMLAKSGDVTLQTGARFLTTKIVPGEGRVTTGGPGPLDGYWPSPHIMVAARVPQNRQIALHVQGSQVFINAPAAARSLLREEDVVTCGGFPGSGSTMSVNLFWTPLAMNVLQRPGCPGADVHWAYAVSAPGYATASDSA